MPSTEIVVVGALVVVCSLLSVLAQYKITQIAASQLAMRVQELDNALGEAVATLFENGASGVQAQNPLLSLLSEALRGKIENPGVVDVTPRDVDGTFKKLEE